MSHVVRRRSRVGKVLAGAALITLASAGWLRPPPRPALPEPAPLTAAPDVARPPAASGYEQARLLEEVIRAVREHSLDTSDVPSLYVRATQGLLDRLQDPYAALLVGEQYRRSGETLAGSYVGVGLELTVRSGSLVVARVRPESPAGRAGVGAGDRVVAIDGQPTEGWSAEQAGTATRGEVGTSVALDLVQTGSDSMVRLTLVRAKLRQRAVSEVAMLRDSVAYISLRIMSGGAAEEVHAATDSLLREGARALVLDLRQNGGGLVDQGIRMADLFLPEGSTIGRLEGKDPMSARTFAASTSEAWPGLPVALLVDSGTASSAELFAAALQDHDRAILVGGKTYGKGIVQTTLPLGKDVAVRLTTGRWYAPSGRWFHRGWIVDGGSLAADSTYFSDAGRVLPARDGLVPDVIVTVDFSAGTKWSQATASRRRPVESDPVVQRALEVLLGAVTTGGRPRV